MKIKSKKIIALILCVLLALGSVGSVVYAFANKNNEIERSKEDNIEFQEKNNETVNTKDETVYVLAGADGSVKKIIVSDWVKNVLSDESIEDISNLEHIINVKGEESYTLGSENSRVWDAQGNDIYYQGDIQKELPVGLSVTYKLDGKTVSADDLVGKSGHVTIRFDYTNRQFDYVNIDGKNEKIFVPFAMMTGMILDNDIFRNVEVSNGKLINDGSRSIVAGIAFPGLAENLNIDKDKFEIPDSVEITADVTDFELSMTVTLATNEIFNQIDPDRLESIDKLKGSINELTGAMGQLMNGSSSLYNGLCTLLDKSGELIKGIDKLAAGAAELKDGTSELSSGALALVKGTNELCTGLNTLKENNKQLNDGAKQVFNTLLKTSNEQLSKAGLDVPNLTIENYAEVLNGIISFLDDKAVYQKALEEVTAAVEAKRDYIEEQVIAAVKSEVKNKVTEAVRLSVEDKVKSAVSAEVEATVTQSVQAGVFESIVMSVTGLDVDSYNEALSSGRIDETTSAAINSAVEAKMISNEIKSMISAKINENMNSAEIIAAIKSNTDAQMIGEEAVAAIEANINAQMQSDEIKMLIVNNTDSQINKAIAENMSGEAVQNKLKAASDGAKSVISLKSSLDSYNVFYLGLNSYTDGVAKAANGASELKNGTEVLKQGSEKLDSGANELYNGILKLKNSGPSLIDGITELRNGSMKLSDGLSEFNEKGVQKLIEVFDGDIVSLTNRVRATIDVSKKYKSFSGISDEMDGNVKFIYRTDSIGK